MTITFYTVTDDKRVVSKTLGSAVHTSTAIVKDDCSIMTPELELAYFSGVSGCNYFYIQEWNRYYFIENMTVGKQRVYLTGKIDVLKTYDAEIRSMTGLVSRSERNYNLYLNDKYFKVLNYKCDELFRFPENSRHKFTNKFYSYVLVVAGAMPNTTPS